MTAGQWAIVVVAVVVAVNGFVIALVVVGNRADRAARADIDRRRREREATDGRRLYDRDV